jgi:hypothetical protein
LHHDEALEEVTMNNPSVIETVALKTDSRLSRALSDYYDDEDESDYDDGDDNRGEDEGNSDVRNSPSAHKPARAGSLPVVWLPGL